MSDPVPTIKELTKLRVVDLKQRLSSLGISTSGLKADLVKRLHEALMTQEGQEFEEFQDDMPSESYNPPPNIQEQLQQDPLERDKELFEHQKEALAFEQVRLLEEEKARQDVERLELGKQQQQMLVDREQQQQLMAETQQQMLSQQEVEMIERGKQQQQILLEMKQNEELAREHRERFLVQTQQRMLVQQQQEEQILHQQQIEESQSFGQTPIIAVHQLQQSPSVQVSMAGSFNPILTTPDSIGQTETVSVAQIVSVPIEPAMTANIAAATQVARRIPHSGPQSMLIPLNPVMTSSGLSQPVTTSAGSYLRSTQAAVVVGPNMDTPQVSLIQTMPSDPIMQVPVIQQQMISTPCTITTMSSMVSIPSTIANISHSSLGQNLISRPSMVIASIPTSVPGPIPAILESNMGPLIPTSPSTPLLTQQMNQSIPLLSQPPPIISQPPPIINQPPPIISQPPPHVNQTQHINQMNQQMKQNQLMTSTPLMPNPPMTQMIPHSIPENMTSSLISSNPPLLQQQMPPQMQPITSSQADNAPLLPTPNMEAQSKPMVPISVPSHQPMQQNMMEPMIPHSIASMPIAGQQPLMGSGPPNNSNAPLLPMPPPIPPMMQHSNNQMGEMMPPPPPPPMMLQQQKVSQPQDDFDGPLLPIPVDMRGNKIPPNAMAYGGNQEKEAAEAGVSQSGEYHLPSAIEKVLALKNVRAQQVGMNDEGEMEAQSKVEKQKQKEKEIPPPPQIIKPLVAVDEDEDEADDEDQAPPEVTTQPTSKQPKESKNKRKKMKKKRARQRKMEQRNNSDFVDKEDYIEKDGDEKSEVEIDYVPDTMEPKDPLYFQFLRIFEKFKLQEPEKPKPELTEEQIKELQRQEEIMNRLAERKKPADIDEKDDDDDDKKEEEKPKLSKRKLKKLSRMTVAELKQRVSRPELVEMHDVTAKDPVLLLHLKAARNSVPVPRHWCFKRKYLQGKRGIEKPPFLLPDFIRKTGIMEMRQALQEKEEAKTMKAKMRERVRPKMGKIDIDYQKLHDAFFKWQIKPRMTIHGDLYYEGKEFETRLKEKKPGDLSEELRIALGMPTGPNQNKCPPPWLIAMQRYGPPPSYPNLKIPGLNAPIPDGCSFGYHAGGWGKPPVDEMGRPLYGDVFNTQSGDPNYSMIDEEVDRTLWGELESESSEESEEESEEEEEEEKIEDETGLVTPAEGLVTPSGLSSVPAGMETPDMIELRKRKIESEMEGGETPALYTVLPERQPERIGASMMGSTHIYDVSAAMNAPKARGVTGAIAGLMPPQGVEVTLDPSELEMDSAAMAARYEQTVREQQSQLAKEDLSDMVAEHAARQKNKRKKQQQQDTGKTAKKYKEFKF